jgi:flagellar hook-associated protein 3 FlgL
MSVTNISTFGALQSLLQNISVSQGNLITDQQQVSSGQKSQTFDGLTGSIQQFSDMNTQVSQLNNFQQSNSVVLSQLQTSNTALSQITQVATSLKSLIASQISGSNSTASFTQQVQSDVASISSGLNTTFQGSYIYGGTNTNTAPVIQPLPASVQVGVPDASYYQGSTQNSTTRIATDQTMPNNIRADNPAFQQIFAGVNQALAANGNATQLQAAENLINQGIGGVIALNATVNANIVNVQQVNSQSQTEQTYFTSLTQNISSADVVTLSTKVAQDQTVLEASFSVFARISSLTLANYLK